MICGKCGRETKRLRLGGAPYYLTLICRVCRRREDGNPWRVFWLLQKIGIYK